MNNPEENFLEYSFETNSVGVLVDSVGRFVDYASSHMTQTLLQKFDFLRRLCNKAKEPEPTNYQEARDPKYAFSPRHVRDVFTELFQVLDKTFPKHTKCLIFDDAEQNTSVLQHLDDFLGQFMQGNIHEKWKIIITTQDSEKEKWLTGCDYLTESNFFKIQGFNLPQIKLYLNHPQELSADTMLQLYDKLGGLPLAWSEIRKKFISLTVSDMSMYFVMFIWVSVLEMLSHLISDN